MKNNQLSMNNLTNDQQKAIQAIWDFLLNPNQVELIIDGGAGTGKTWLINYINQAFYDEYKKLCSLFNIKPLTAIFVTATTNKAVSVLNQKLSFGSAITIHKLLKVIPSYDFHTGETILIRPPSSINKFVAPKNSLIIIDECSMIDKELAYILNRDLDDSNKIIYVGDKCQLPPVNESISTIYSKAITNVNLSEPVRNKGFLPLVQLCSQLRETVLTNQFKDIQLVPGVIDYIPDEQSFINEVKSVFNKPQLTHRILSYTNELSLKLNEMIATQVKQYNKPYVANEYYICNSPYKTPQVSHKVYNKQFAINNEEVVKIVSIKSKPTKKTIKATIDFDTSFEDKEQIEYYEAQVISQTTHASYKVNLTQDPIKYRKLLQKLKRQKRHAMYAALNDFILDIRAFEAMTIHKSQGSTFETVYINLSDLGKCRNPYVVSRLLYVAVSRASNRVVFTGSLPKEYGKLLCSTNC